MSITDGSVQGYCAQHKTFVAVGQLCATCIAQAADRRPSCDATGCFCDPADGSNPTCPFCNPVLTVNLDDPYPKTYICVLCGHHETYRKPGVTWEPPDMWTFLLIHQEIRQTRAFFDGQHEPWPEGRPREPWKWLRETDVKDVQDA